MKFYTGKYDRVFKSIIVDGKNNHKILKAILKSILKREIEDIEILRNELPVKSIDERSKTVDLLVKTQEKYIHVELNTNVCFKFRNYIFFSNIIDQKTKRGEEYIDDYEFIHIDLNFVKGNKGNEINEYYVQTIDGKKYISNVRIIEYNIDKKIDFWYSENGKIKEEYQYLVMLDLELKELDNLALGDEVVMEYREELKELNKSEEFQAYMTVEEDRERILNTEKIRSYRKGVSEGISEGIIEGIKNNKKEVIENLQEMHMPLDQIAKVVNMSVEKLEEFIKKEIEEK